MLKYVLILNLVFVCHLASTQTTNQAQFDEWEVRSFKASLQKNIVSLDISAADVVVSIHANDTIAPVLSTQFGINTTFRSENSLVDRANNYKPFGSFRFPAGSGSDRFFWDCNIPSSLEMEVNPICGTAGNNLTLENFVKFKNNANGEPTVVVNYFYARYGVTSHGTREARVLQAAKYAAGLVHKLNIELGGKIKYWEIGNECYGKWETGYDVNGSIVTGKEYGEDFKVFVIEMKKIDSDIHIGAVMGHKHVEWNNAVLKEVKNYADFLIIHHYFNNINSQTDIATTLSEIRDDLTEINDAVVNQTGKPRGYYPIAYTEFNSRGAYTTSMMNGFFVTEAILQMIKNRVSLSTIWVNEWKLNDNHTKGVFALEDHTQANYSPRPSYLPYYYLDKYLGDYLVKTTSTGSDKIKVIGSQFSSGELGLVIINYDNSAIDVSFDLTDEDMNYDSLYWDVAHVDNTLPGTTKFFVNGATSNTLGGGPHPLSSVAMNVASYEQGKVLVLPKLSITYLVLIPKSQPNTGTSIDIKNSSFTVFPNPCKDQLTIRSASAIKYIKLYDIYGRNLIDDDTVVNREDKVIQIDVTHFSNGIYFLKMNNEIIKILVQN